jgi:hypothetical protein
MDAMTDPTNTPDRPVISRAEHRLSVTPRASPFDLAAMAGENISAEDHGRIAAFLEDREGAEDFLSTVRSRLERTSSAQGATT